MIRARERLILTPEHVQIRLTPAGLGSRFLALVVDGSLLLSLAGFAAQVARVLLPGALGQLVGASSAFLITWGYHVYFEVRHQGRSPGKALVGLRVVDGRGLPIGLEQSFVRNVVRVLDFAPLGYGLGAAVAQVDREGRRLGDLAADTLVIREGREYEYDRRASRSRDFNSLRTPRVLRLLRHRVSLEEREFLSTLCMRAEELENRARFDLMEDVARWYRVTLEIDDPHLSGENLVRGLTAILYSDRGKQRPRVAVA
jgi:uncharacterized RDD family membrane protein YckC